MKRQYPIQTPEEVTLSKLKFDFVRKSRDYNNCHNAAGRRVLAQEIDVILDWHTELEAALGIVAIEQSIQAEEVA